MKKVVSQLVAVIILGTVLFLFTELSVGEEQKQLPAMNLTLKVEKIFGKNCATSGCHKGAYPKKKLNLESDKFLKSLVDKPSLQAGNYKLVDTQNPGKSYLLMKVKGDSGIVKERMPVDAPPLKAAEIKAIEDWVNSLKKIHSKKEKALPGEGAKKKLKRQ